MQIGTRHFLWLFIRLAILALFFMPFLERAMALDELPHLYDSPQGLSMGNAFTADAEGYAALYYNPACLAKTTKERWVFTPIDFEGIFSTSWLSRFMSAKSFGITKMISEMKANPGKYASYRATLIPSASRRDFGLAVLDSYYFAAQSDGSRIDINAGQDLAPTFGAALAVWGGRIRMGLTAKAILRNQLKGTYAHDDVSSEAAVSQQMKEGLGLGADFGMLFTLPVRYLPMLAIVWHDMGNTRFTHTSILNAANGGAPEAISQSYDAAVSIHPNVAKGWRSTVALSVDHIERRDVIFRKRTHIGFQVDNTRNLYLWIGLNQLYFTTGVGYRIPGGDLELGTYGEDIGVGATPREDRRFYIRYSIGF